jgi:hypothetical protein
MPRPPWPEFGYDAARIGRISAVFADRAAGTRIKARKTALPKNRIFGMDSTANRPCRCERENFYCRKTEIVSMFGRPAPARGALRDRHERRTRDAMDAMGQRTVFVRTTDLIADGEVVWSWHPDADAKSR